MNKDNKVSAFKIFYDEFVYKENTNVSYANVDRNIKKIRELTMEIRKASKVDLEEYGVKLERINKRIKEQLNEIYKLNKTIFEYFYLLYKSRVEICNDKVEDMPFLVSCSFYDDYRLDNKTVLQMESSPFVVPKYSSLEKKSIRNDAKSLTKLEYFVKLISESQNRDLYDKFIEKAKVILAFKPLVNESHAAFFARGMKNINNFKHLYERVCEKVKSNDDYEIISDMMMIAFKKKFISWEKEFDNLITEHLDETFKKMKDSFDVRGCFNIANDISFESFVELADSLILEKEKYMEDASKGLFEPVYFADDSYITKFRETLINSFFDKRYYDTLNAFSTMDDFVERAIQLYGLAEDLTNQIFERIMFDASHADSLKRNNDVKSAVINKIYDLYNPLYLLGNFETARNKFNKLLECNSEEFLREYNLNLVDKKLEYDYHGPIPSMKTIQTKIIEKRKRFILDYCITDLKSRDILEDYDTRNYDLEVMALDIPINDMVELYEQIKNKINSFDFSSICFFNKESLEEGYEKKITLKAAQEFVCKDIFRKLKLKDLSFSEINNKYKDICYGYFNEDCMFVDKISVTSVVEDYSSFLKIRKKYNEVSKWNKFLIFNKIKNNL